MSFTVGYDPNLAWREHPLVVVIDDRILLQEDAVFGLQRWGDIAQLGGDIVHVGHLGTWAEQPVALLVLRVPEELKALLPQASLRSLLSEVTPEQFDLLGRALQLVNWRNTHRYCGHCGQPTFASPVELSLICPSCQATYYPRISPCVIGLVNHGRKLLLAHHIRHKDPRYSLLAGFIEAGESAEQALAREVAEEAGIKIANITYVTSQPWPFPGQLMLGFFAEYSGGDIQPDPNEIVDARWFDIDDLPLIPPPQTIAGKLIHLRVAQLRALG